MIKRALFLAFALVLAFNTTKAQDAAAAPKEGWTRTAGLGLSLDQLFLLNPQAGAGLNRFGFGGVVTWSANLKRGMHAWDNSATVALGVQKLGTGLLAQGSTLKVPFLKNVDQVLFGSKYGHSFKAGSKWFYATDFSFQSQLLPTYQGGYLKDTSSLGALSKLFAPAFVTLSIGVDYKPNDHWSIYYSPIAYKANIVLDDEIASKIKVTDADGTARGAYGNKIVSATDFDKVFHQVGSLLRVGYQDKYFADKIAFKSNLGLFSNYLREPQNIDVMWTNELSWDIFKGLGLGLFVNTFYDHDVQVQISDPEAVNGVKPGVTGRRVSLTENFVVKYNKNF